MNFDEADHRYNELKRRYEAGAMSAQEFDAALKEMMVEDTEGRWWSRSRETGSWHVYDAASDRWMDATPPSTRSPSPSTYPSPDVSARQIGGPEVSSGAAIVLYIFSFVVPLVGILVYFVYKDKPHAADRNVAKVSLILGLVSIVLSCTCGMLSVLLSGSGGYY